jgi:hypothetical protein
MTFYVEHGQHSNTFSSAMYMELSLIPPRWLCRYLGAHVQQVVAVILLLLL